MERHAWACAAAGMLAGIGIGCIIAQRQKACTEHDDEEADTAPDDSERKLSLRASRRAAAAKQAVAHETRKRQALSGQELYMKAKTLIPGGTQLLSKRPEMFLPDVWPSYYSRAKGCYVWDLDGRKYQDMICSPGCFALGAADPDVNAAVHEAVERGSFSTLNAPEEVELAELLIELHPWCKGGMVRYARGGGEINSIAVRIARAHTGRDVIAFCGYHGWCDWYLAANVSEEGSTVDGIAGHQLSGLDPAGVPKGLGGTNLGWRYGKLEELERIFAANSGNVAAVVMEVARSENPPEGFLQSVRDLSRKHGALLIFDEVSAAWREVLGGRHLQYGVWPDMAMFSKTISNGFAMAAVIGVREVMESCQNTFVSSTYWTERIGPVAALATIRKFQRCQVQKHLRRMGAMCKQGWVEAADSCGLKIAVSGFDAWPGFAFAPEYDHLLPSPDSTADAAADAAGDFARVKATTVLATLFTQRMLERGFLASTSNVMTFAHKREHVRVYLEAVAAVFATLADWIEEVKIGKGHLHRHLRGPVKHGGFERLVS